MIYCESSPQLSSPVCGLATSNPRASAIDIIVPGNSPVASAQMVVDLFRAANELVHGTPYEITVQKLSSQSAEDARYWANRSVIFLGDIHERWHLTPDERNRTCQILRLANRSVLIGGAIFLLCETGLQERHSVAIHPNFSAAAAEEQLVERVPGAHSAMSGSVCTAVSSFAALRLLLEFVGEDHGQFTAGALSDYLGLSAEVRQQQSKVSMSLVHLAQGDHLIENCLEVMRHHLEEPLKIGELAHQLGVSTRKLQRRFLDLTGSGPLSAYRALRIERAYQLLEHTNLPLSEIVVATGFGTCSNLARWFRREYGETPQTVRRRSFRGRRASNH